MLDDGLPARWPAGVKEACSGLSQGDVLDFRPLFYMADSRRPVWLLTTALGESQDESGEERGLAVAELEQGSRLAPAYAIITSQTCDIGEQAPIWEYPWIQVAPVYEIHDAQLLQRQYFFRLTAPQFQLGTFVADLRIEMPVEKGALTDLRADPGFETEQDAIAFAEVLGRRRQRAAIATVVNTQVRETLRQRINAKRPTWRAIRNDVHKLMLAIEDGSRRDPRLVRLFVVSHAPLSQEATIWFDEWYEQARESAAAAGLALAPVSYMNRTNFDLARYDSLIEINKNF